MARFYAAVREPVERHGGTVEKVIGDALVAVFGIPVVHEDDALRAVRAALEMRDAVRAMGEHRGPDRRQHGRRARREPTLGESLVVGDAVNVAARLEQAAPPGEVLVGEATWALVAHAVRGRARGGGAGEGKVASRSLRLAARGVDTAAVAQRRRLDLPMVGRESELDLLRWAARADRPSCSGRTWSPCSGSRGSGSRGSSPSCRGSVTASAPGRALPGDQRDRRRSSRWSRSARGATSSGRITAAEVDALMSGTRKRRRSPHVSRRSARRQDRYGVGRSHA